MQTYPGLKVPENRICTDLGVAVDGHGYLGHFPKVVHRRGIYQTVSNFVGNAMSGSLIWDSGKVVTNKR